MSIRFEAVMAAVCVWALGCGSSVETHATGGGPDSGNGGLTSGSGGASSSSGGASGSVSSGGATPGAGGAAGGIFGSGGTGAAGSGVSELTACRTYLEKACARTAECSGSSPYTCLQFEAQCPDFLFSPGSNRQPDELVACAATWATFDCGSVLADAAPPCAIRGSKMAHEPCSFGSQCASLLCSSSVTCGECLPEVADGAACDSTVTCPPDEGCASSVCAKPASAMPPPATPPGTADGPCTTDCVTGYVCQQGTCAVPPAPGEPCTGVCSPPASCIGPQGQHACAVVGQEGDACASGTPSCIPGAGCVQGRCVATGLQGLFASACDMHL